MATKRKQVKKTITRKRSRKRQTGVRGRVDELRTTKKKSTPRRNSPGDAGLASGLADTLRTLSPSLLRLGIVPRRQGSIGNARFTPDSSTINLSRLLAKPKNRKFQESVASHELGHLLARSGALGDDLQEFHNASSQNGQLVADEVARSFGVETGRGGAITTSRGDGHLTTKQIRAIGSVIRSRLQDLGDRQREMDAQQKPRHR